MDQQRTSSESADGFSVGHSEPLSPRVGERLRALAEVYLRAVAIGAPASELAEALATAVISSDLVRLANAVLTNDEFRVVRATELAAKLLDSAATVATNSRADGRHG